MTNVNEVSSLNEDVLRTLNHYGFVTALKIEGKFIVAGYGCILKVFCIEGNSVSMIFSEQVFKRNKIHHISFSHDGEVLSVSGARSFSVIEFKSLVQDPSKTRIEEKAINEWIISTEFLTRSNLLILTSHNVVYSVDVSSAEGKFDVIDIVHCNEKSILYSGSIRILSDGTVFIAAGTVMSGVLIWNFNTKKILHNLTEHEGSIFGVKIDQNGKYVISCSDDRSIKLYELESGKLLASGWGHGSRIWNLEFFKKDAESKLKIFSTGEDCTARIWQYQPDSEVLVQLDLWDNCHLGKHVWSGDVDDETLKLCVTGGSDGRIRIHDLSNRGITSSHTPEEITDHTGHPMKTNESIKHFCELSKLNLLVCLTSCGDILVLDQSESKWSRVHLDPEEIEQLGDFGLLEAFPSLNTVLICCRNGDILYLTFADKSVNTVEKNWLRGTMSGSNKMINLLSHSGWSSKYHHVLVDCPNPNAPFLLHTFTETDGKIALKTTRELFKPNHKSFTTTALLVDEENNWLIIGSRFTSFAVYDLDSPESSLDVAAVFRKTCPGDSISSISVVESFKGNTTLLITVKDGVYVYVRLFKNEAAQFEIDIIHQNKLTRGFVEGGFVKNGDLIVYGFRSSYFYIWNETLQLEITNVLCGGAHRKWQLFNYKDLDSSLDYKFVYMNKNVLQVRSFKGRFNDQNYGLINEGTHGREIRDVSVSPFLQEDGTKLIISASEDTTLRLGKLSSNGSIKNYWSLNSHVSGLQTVKFIDSRFAASSAANEEFIIWKLDALSNGCPTIKEYSRLRPKSDVPDLRIMDFDTIPVEDGFIISTVYSDSNIKILHFNITTKSFTYLADDYYSTCCILNVHFLKMDCRDFLMIGTTDGFLTIWEITSILQDSGTTEGSDSVSKNLGKMVIKQQLHQNGIKAVHVIASKDEFTIVTGGDDNSLILNRLSIIGGKLVLESKSFIESAASATITSISSGGHGEVVSTSVDQIVRLWSLKDDTLTCKGARYTTVADTGCSDHTSFGDVNMVVIAGAGLSTWSV